MKQNDHLFIMTSTLRHIYGGRTNSLLHRARLLTENKTGIKKITLLTCNYNPNYEEVYQDYREKNSVNKNIDFLNLYDWLKDKYIAERKSKYVDRLKTIFEKEIENNYLDYLENNFGTQLSKVPGEKSRNHTFYYDNGLPQYHLSYNRKEKRIGHIDVYLDHVYHSAKRLYINAKGNIHKIRYYRDKPNNNILRDVFVDDEMNAYLTREFYYKKKKLHRLRDILFNGDGSVKIFRTETELFTYWFKQLFVDGDKVISDARVLDMGLINVDKDIKRIFQAHGPHLVISNENKSELKGSFKPLFENIAGEHDVIVVLTEAQKVDIIKRFPHLENKVKVIPHSIEVNKVNNKTVVPKTINIVSRLVSIKRIDHVLKAFNLFLKEKPDYTLNIYGHGDKETELKELTETLNIENNVNFKGYTTNVNQVFQTSEFTLLTSEYEGFGLTVLEGIANGCPVISYDIKWGPNEMIEAHNGILIKNGDIDGLKDAMVYIADHPFNRKKVAQINDQFTKKAFLKEWTTLLKN